MPNHAASRTARGDRGSALGYLLRDQHVASFGGADSDVVQQIGETRAAPRLAGEWVVIRRWGAADLIAEV
jgi:hypothetical protein